MRIHIHSARNGGYIMKYGSFGFFRPQNGGKFLQPAVEIKIIHKKPAQRMVEFVEKREIHNLATNRLKKMGESAIIVRKLKTSGAGRRKSTCPRCFSGGNMPPSLGCVPGFRP